MWAEAQVASDMLHKAGFNIDLQALDWGTVVQRRASREPADKGGWNIFYNYLGGFGNILPASNLVIRGNGTGAWFGWPTNPKLEELRTQWFQLTNADDRVRVAHEIQVEAFKTLPYIPLCYSFNTVASSKKITGVTKSPIASFWEIDKVA
jgi:peptide/nickel transport system substrate-binding protein